MPKVRAQVVVPGPRHAAEELFYDLARWPGFVDGFAAVVKREGGWPEAGGRLIWDSRPNGRGRVLEVVKAMRAGEGQVVDVDDPRLRATQTTSFDARGDDVLVTVEWDYELKDVRFPASLFVRRALGDSLTRTMQRYRLERIGDADLEASGV